MRQPPLILAVDDTAENLEILSLRLTAHGYAVETAPDGEQGLKLAREIEPDLILLDVMMPKLDGIAVVRELKRDPKLRAVPVILVTAKADTRDVVEGLEAGGDDYLTKPFEHAALVARVRSMLRIKALHDEVQAQAQLLERQASELADWNRLLESRVAAQVDEIGRMARLRRFLPAAVADSVIAAEGARDLLDSHRGEVTVVFCDLRGFTSFAETAEPEEVVGVLREYHGCIGELVSRYDGTLERFVGDGALIIFNDPMPQEDHAARAVRMSLDMRDRVQALAQGWRRRGHALGFGVGVAGGYATIGAVGFEDRLEYSVIGTVPNLASRLCDEAKAGQILLSQRVFSAVEPSVEAHAVGDLELKGFHRPVPAFELVRWRS